MKIAFVFPGQGSQSLGMLDAYGDLPGVNLVIEEASDILGQDVARLVREGPVSELNSTINTQPVMVTVGVAAYRAWIDAGGPEPVIAAGHSLGEYSALVASGVITLRDCLPLVRLRAQAMQAAVPIGEGAMAALLGLSDDAVIFACKQAAQAEVVEAVNFNAPGQVVIAGHAKAVTRAIECAKAAGAKRAVVLPVSAPFHSSLMRPAADALRKALSQVEFQRPKFPVVHNIDGRSRGTVEEIKEALVRQADHPVMWVKCVERITDEGVKLVFECGPGKVLAPLCKRISSGLEGIALTDGKSIETSLSRLSEAA